MLLTLILQKDNDYKRISYLDIRKTCKCLSGKSKYRLYEKAKNYN